MPDQTVSTPVPTTPPQQMPNNVPDKVVVNNSLDMDGLKALSRAEYSREVGYDRDKPDGAPITPQKPRRSVISGSDFEEETQEEPEKVEPKKEAPPADEVTEEVEEEETPEEEEEEETEEEGQPEKLTEQDLADEKLHKKYLVVKHGEDQLKIPWTAKGQIKVDGKLEDITVREAFNRASGAMFVERETSRLGSERKQLEQERLSFEQEAETTNRNVETLVNLAQYGDPEDFVQYYGLLTGQDPAKVLDGLATRILEYVDKFSNMTERERELYNQNRRYEFERIHAQRESEQKARAEGIQRDKAQVEEFLTSKGLTWDDWKRAAQDVHDRIQAGTLRGKFSGLDIAQHAELLAFDTRVKEGIAHARKSLVEDKAFVNKVARILLREESSSGSKYTKEQISEIAADLAGIPQKVSESLSKKAERAKATGKANSQKANSQKPKQRVAESYTLRDHYDRVWGKGD